MNKPTLEEYEKAKQAYETYSLYVHEARQKKNDLIDMLAVERQNEKFYTDLAAQQREVIVAYEIYEQTENKNATCEKKQCGNCAFAKSTTWGNKPSNVYVECTNKEHIEKHCKKELSVKRPRTTKGCQEYISKGDLN